MTVFDLLAKSNPKFKDFRALRVGGKDEYSRLGHAALKSRITPTDISTTEASFEIHAERAKVYRWILRGLPVDYAIRKVKTDLEVAAHAQHAEEEEKWWEDHGEAAMKSLACGEITQDELEELIHPPTQDEEIEVAGYTVLRPHANKVIITKDGEILGEKEINGDRHFENFVAKFGRDKQYRNSCIPQ